MTEIIPPTAANHPRLHLLRGGDLRFVAIFVYYWTDIGGPTLLAMTLIPVIFVIVYFAGVARK